MKAFQCDACQKLAAGEEAGRFEIVTRTAGITLHAVKCLTPQDRPGFKCDQLCAGCFEVAIEALDRLRRKVSP